MQVRLLTDRAGAVEQREGDIIELPEREAYRLIQRGQAEAVEPECAAVATAESTVHERPRFKRK